MTAPPQPRRLLMTLDAVGGVWRYAMDLASGLRELGVETVFACLGPAPSAARRAEAEAIGRLVSLDLPLDWLAADAAELAEVPARLVALAEAEGADVLHLNLPSQAAGISTDLPVIVVSHSCVVTWFEAVRGTPVPPDWQWQYDLNRAGLLAADRVVSPSASHAAALRRCYDGPDGIEIVYNAVTPLPALARRDPVVLAAGRWWDDGKNAATLDAAAAATIWPVRMAGSLEGPNGATRQFAHAQSLGELPAPRLRAELSRAGIFVSPSLYEPFGLAPLEAASAGLPLVLADIPTFRELWDGAALFAAPREPQEFAQLLNRLAGDSGLRDRLGAAAQLRALGFTRTRQAEAMLGLYAGALRDRQRQPMRTLA